MRISLVAILILATSAFLAACGDASTDKGDGTITQPSTFYFSAIPDDDESVLKARFEPTAAYLSEKLGIKVVYKPVKKYALAVEAMKSKDVYLAWFGGLTGVQARELTGGEAIAMGQADAAFYSYLIAHPSSGIKASKEFPTDIAGKTFTFGSKSSTSGRLMPEAFIRKHMGKAPSEIFSGDPGFTGSHNLTVESVGKGSFQVGAVNGKTFDRMKAEGKAGEAYIVWKTPFYADYNWSVPGDIDKVYGAGFKDRLKKALLELDSANSDHAKILKGYDRKKFIAATNADFSGIKKTADALGVTRP